MSKDISTCDICMSDYCQRCVVYDTTCVACGSEACGDEACGDVCSIKNGCGEFLCKKCKTSHNCKGEKDGKRD